VDFSPLISIFNFEKPCFQPIISHYGEFHRIQPSCLKTNTLEGFLSSVVSSLAIEGTSHQVLPRLSPLLRLKKFRPHLPHNAVDILKSLIDTWNSHLNHRNRKVEYLAISSANRLQQVFQRTAPLLWLVFFV
jgi:hypothetical protein